MMLGLVSLPLSLTLWNPLDHNVVSKSNNAHTKNDKKEQKNRMNELNGGRKSAKKQTLNTCTRRTQDAGSIEM